MNYLMRCGLAALMGFAISSARAGQPPVPPPPAPQGTNAAGPHIVFETPVYDFGKVKAGELVKFTYAFTNTGTEVLEVTHVQPSCGCTAAGEFTRKVEPGGTGSIPIQFNSANFNGQVFKTVTVNCNDKAQPSVVLQLKGTIWKPIEYIPQYAVLNIPPDAPEASTTVRITNHTDELITLSPPEISNPAFTATLTTNTPGKEYQLLVKGVGPFSTGTIQGQINLRTSSTGTPLLAIPFWANIQPAIMVLPPQVALPPAPLSAATTPSLTIQNNSTNLLKITDPAINVPGVDVKVQEMQPGRTFAVTMAFPAGTQLPNDRQVLFTAKTSNPRFAEIKVPITQPVRPNTPPAIPTAPMPIPLGQKPVPPPAGQ